MLSVATSAPAQETADKEKQELRTEVLEDLVGNILPFWKKYAPDPSGGFYGTLLFDGTPKADAEKGLVLNARILWTFSTAYRLFKDESYKELADRAQAWFLHFIDTKHGGAYWSVKADGSPDNTNKQTYGIAFGIYGLSAHFRATGNMESLQSAIALYRALEEHAFDPINGGYTESFTRDWQTPERYGYDGKGIAAKTMNTHLHVLEAYTALYTVWADDGLQKQLHSLTRIIIDKIVDKNTWHEKLFLTADWQNLEDIDSYGHDMEFSWLLTEAAETLGNKALIRECREIAVHFVDTQTREGLNADGSLIYEKQGDHRHTNLDWWPQAETVVAFYNAWQITGDRKYLDNALKTWGWIRDNMIDREYGEWYSAVTAEGIPAKKRSKADLWRCPYHNSRMGFELFHRIK